MPFLLAIQEYLIQYAEHLLQGIAAMFIHILLVLPFIVSQLAAAPPSAKPQELAKSKEEKLAASGSSQKNDTSVSRSVSEPKIAERKPEKKSIMFDRIEAVIYGPEVTEIVTRSDVMRSLDGRTQTLDEVIFQRLMVQDALKMRIMTDESAVDDYILKVAKSYGGTLDDINQMFEQAGFTPMEGRRRFAELYAIQQLREYKILSRVFVPEKEVIAYYEANPVVKTASYVIERAVVQTPAARQEETRKKLDTYIKTGQGMLIGWTQLPEIFETDLAADKQFITKLELGQVAEPIEFPGGFELFRLKAKTSAHVEPLEDRYREIVDVLRRPKADQLFEEYKKELWANASILYF